jgi:RNA-directed DNA polymerase
MDFTDFFSSVTSNDISRHLDAYNGLLPSGWDASDTKIFLTAVCKGASLTIGAVTSPAISNTVCFNLDESLTQLSKQHSVIYTRYADDLFFSTDTPGTLRIIGMEVNRIISSQAYPSGLRINTSKTFHYSKRDRRSVTGLVLTSDGGTSLGHSLKRRLRGMIHRLDLLTTKERTWLAGFLAHAKSVEPEFINRLYLKFPAALLDRARHPK